MSGRDDHGRRGEGTNKRKTIAEHAYQHCKDNDYLGVGYGDSFLLHEIAEVAGLPHRSWRTERQILNALDRSKQGLFVKWFYRGRRGFVRTFYRFDALPITPTPPRSKQPRGEG